MISVIIPTYKEPDYLDLCLQSAIEGQENQNQIIVVVDGFYDINKQVLDKYKGKIDVVDLGDNYGLARATNMGVYNAKHDKILVVNDDNVFPYAWDTHLLDMYRDNSVLSPNQIEPNPSMFKQFHIHDLGKTIEEFNLDKFWEYEQSIAIIDIDFCGSTLPFMMQKSDYLRLGGWDENYPTNGVVADWDFFLKCRMSKLPLYRTYNCHFYHFAQVATGTNRQEVEMQGHEYARYKWGSYIQHDPVYNRKFITTN
jgi:GT2 family glycosyltransferase